MIPDLAPASGGPVTAALGMTRALAAAGIEVRLLATSFGSPPSPRGLDAALFPCRTNVWRFAPDLGRALRDEVKRADLVHVHTLWTYPTFAAARAAWRAGVPYVVRPCGMLDAWSVGQKALRKRLYLRLLEDRTIEGAAALHWTSETERRGAVRQGRHGFVLPLGLAPEVLDAPANPAAFRARFPTVGDRPVVLFLGRLHGKKQPGLLLEAFTLARKRIPAAVLVLAGPGSPEERRGLESRVEAAGLSDHVCFTGLLRGGETRDALAAASLFVLPSLQENFGMAVAEALAAACPVVVSPQVGLAEAVRTHAAGLVVQPTADTLADAIVDLMSDEPRRAVFGENGRRLARTLSWTALAPRLIATYEELLGSGPRTPPA